MPRLASYALLVNTMGLATVPSTSGNPVFAGLLTILIVALLMLMMRVVKAVLPPMIALVRVLVVALIGMALIIGAIALMLAALLR
jgi:hypothetical protein